MAFLFLPNTLSQQAWSWNPSSSQFVCSLSARLSPNTLGIRYYRCQFLQTPSLQPWALSGHQTGIWCSFLAISACLFNRHFNLNQIGIVGFSSSPTWFLLPAFPTQKWHTCFCPGGSRNLFTGLLLLVTVLFSPFLPQQLVGSLRKLNQWCSFRK